MKSVLCEMKCTLDEINGRLDTIEENRIRHEDIAIETKQTECLGDSVS